MIFCDTSALAKLYVSEPESVVLRQITDAEDEVCVSELARAELMGVSTAGGAKGNGPKLIF